MRSTRRLKHVISTALLPISLVMLIQAAIFGQAKQDQVRVEVASQTGSPVQLTAIGVRDNPNFEAVQMVEFTIQNISQKRIIAFSPFLSSASFMDGSTTEGRYDFEPGKVIQTFLQVDRNKLKAGEKLTLSVDYILFSDLTGWGPDTQKHSEFEAGYYDGEKYAIDQVRRFIKEQNKEELIRLLRLEQDGKIDDNSLQMDKEKTERWRRGFLGGYRLAIGQLLPFDQKQGKRVPINDKMSLDDFAGRLKYVECIRSTYLDNPN